MKRMSARSADNAAPLRILSHRLVHVRVQLLDVQATSEFLRVAVEGPCSHRGDKGHSCVPGAHVPSVVDYWWTGKRRSASPMLALAGRADARRPMVQSQYFQSHSIDEGMR